MEDINIDTIQKNLDRILEIVGTTAFAPWQKFTHSTSEVINSIDEFNKRMVVFKESQHRHFMQSMKKLKSVDLPDLIGAVKSKKLPKEALKGVVCRFKMVDEKIQLIDSIDGLKQSATKQLDQYLARNNSFLNEIKKFQGVLDEKIKQFGFGQEEPVETLLQSTVQFNFSEEQAKKIADEIKVDYVPGTSYISFKTYSDIVNRSYDLIKEENQKLTKQARKKQREYLKDHSKYIEIMSQFIINGEALIIEGQKYLSKKVGLSENKFIQSQTFLMERGLGNYMVLLQTNSRTKIKQSITPTQSVSYEKAKEVIQFQIEMIDAKKQEIKDILKNIEKSKEQIQLIPYYLALILNDMVFQKFGFEEEDFMKNISEEVISTHPQMQKMFKDMEIEIIKIMAYLQIINPEVSKYMQEGVHQKGEIQEGQKQLQHIPYMVPNMMNGMIPGNSPMQMLQIQQLKQMQQAQQGPEAGNN